MKRTQHEDDMKEFTFKYFDSDLGRERDAHVTVDTNGIVRWVSSGNVPPSPTLEDVAKACPAPVDVEASKVAKREDSKKAAAEYREYRRKNGYSAEERFEMRAAFGAGETVVDVLTGKTFKT